jgi:biopolymer transport protein ExbB/biopolymer transport protein TolQ
MQFDMAHLWSSMGWVAKGVVFTLLIMSIWSISIIFDRWKLFNNAKSQSRKYAADVARLLKAGKLKEAVDLSGSAGMKSSHLAKVSLAGLQEWQFQGATGETDKDAALEAAKRAMQRATAVNLADLKKGLSFLATTGATAPFVGLFGTTFGIINAFSGMAMTGSGGIAAISAGIAEALITTALGLVVAIVAVWAYNYFAGQVDGFTVEMDNSGSELLDFVKKSA